MFSGRGQSELCGSYPYSNCRCTECFCQAKPLRSVILSRMEEDEQEIYEEVYSNRGNLQTYKTPVELNWYAYISTYYGYSVNNGTGQTQLHRGVTINVRQGTEVKSAMNGFVVDVGYSGTFGNYVVTQDKKVCRLNTLICRAFR